MNTSPRQQTTAETEVAGCTTPAAVTTRPVSALHLEHLNLNVRDLARTTALLQALVPAWQVRGEGVWMDGDHPRRWRHVGDGYQYLALYEAAPDEPMPGAAGPALFNHLGLQVDDLDAALARVAALGVPLDHVGGHSAHRRSAYVRLGAERLEVELVAYDRDDAALRNAYEDMGG